MFTLGRKIDIHYKTNRWILIIGIIVTGLSYILTREFSIAWKTGASVFLTWALTREIDPKREYAAFVSSFFVLSSLLVNFQVDLMVIFFLLLTLRLVNKVVGDNNTIFDMFTLLGFAGFLSFNKETSAYILILLLSLFLNSKTTKDKKINTVFFILTTLVLFVELFLIGGFRISGFMGKGILITGFVSIFLFLIFILLDNDKATLNDNGLLVESQTILKAQILFALGLGIMLIYTSIPIGNLIVYLSSIWGYMIYGTISMLKKKKIQA